MGSVTPLLSDSQTKACHEVSELPGLSGAGSFGYFQFSIFTRMLSTMPVAVDTNTASVPTWRQS